MRKLSKYRGFTIVELLVVIVIIGILATIVILSYNNVMDQASESSVQSDVNNAGILMSSYLQRHHQYPQDPKDANDGKDLPSSGGNTVAYSVSDSGRDYCVSVTDGSVTYHRSSVDGNKTLIGDCSGITFPVPLPLTMQTMTPSYCSSMTVYTGSNPSALITLTDNRDGTTRSYTVGKLADNNCWMLDNLKLGSTTGTVTLTPADSNVSANYTLPQVDTSANGTTGNTSEYSTARVYQTPGDTGSGSTNYGYLYSFTAATAGATTTSLPMGTGDAPDSICPAGWRLPSGRATTGDFAKLDIAMGGTGAYQSSAPQAAKWNYAGPLRGVFAGYWVGGFVNQGSYSYLWSSSAYSSDVSYAWNAYFSSSFVFPGVDYGLRSAGLGVRCLLN